MKFDKFRCVNTVTRQAINLRRDDPRMEAAQCLSAGDYANSSAWVDQIIELARKHCK